MVGLKCKTEGVDPFCKFIQIVATIDWSTIDSLIPSDIRCLCACVCSPLLMTVPSSRTDHLLVCIVYSHCSHTDSTLWQWNYQCMPMCVYPWTLDHVHSELPVSDHVHSELSVQDITTPVHSIHFSLQRLLQIIYTNCKKKFCPLCYSWRENQRT